LQPSPGLPPRKAAARRQQRVLDMLHTLPLEAQRAVQAALEQEYSQELAYRDAVAHGERPQEITSLITGS
jgi:hypothetical protein